MSECRCRRHQPWCHCPAMLFSKENRRKSIQILYCRCKLLAVLPIFYFLHAVNSLPTQGDWLIGVVTRILMHLPMRSCWAGLISPTAAEQSWLRYPKGECRGQCSRSGSISQRYRSGSGFSCYQAKIGRKTLISTDLWLLKGAQAWPSRGWVFLHKADTYG